MCIFLDNTLQSHAIPFF